MSEYESEAKNENKVVNAILIIAICLIVLLILAVLFPVYGDRGAGSARKSASISNAKQVALGMIMYAADWDEHLPPSNHWEDRLYPKYIYRAAIVELVIPPGNPPQRFAYNADVVGTDISTMNDVANTVLIFETDSTYKNTVGRVGISSTFPKTVQTIICYVDGHVTVKGIGAIPSLIWKPTFSAPIKKSAPFKQSVTK